MKQLLSALALSVVMTGAAYSADILGGGNYCAIAENAQLLGISDNATLTGEVERMMSEAIDVADSDEWIASQSPAFTWASEAKVACGKAYGYLQSDYRDEQYLNKCECFHERMVSYMY